MFVAVVGGGWVKFSRQKLALSIREEKRAETPKPWG